MYLHPIVFGIPQENVVSCVPEKHSGFSPLIPGFQGTYKWGTAHESEYYRHYRGVQYAITRQKHGWVSTPAAC